MKLNYYGYSLARREDDKRILMDLRPLLKAFCQFDNPHYKNRFTHKGEQVYLFHISGNLFLFIMTRSKEVIKKIDSKDLVVTEIYDLLSGGENLGFASYLYIEASFYGLASSFMAPKANAFAEYVNDILTTLNITDYSFISYPLLHQTTRADALKMPFIGRSAIQVTKENNLFEHVRNMMNGTAEEFTDVDSFEIILKPRFKQNIEAAARKLISNTPDAGLDKLVVRAREELEGPLVDFYLAGKGAISDEITTKDERLLYDEMARKVTSNEILKGKVSSHESDNQFSNESIEAIARYGDVAAWSGRFDGVQPGNE